MPKVIRMTVLSFVLIATLMFASSVYADDPTPTPDIPDEVPIPLQPLNPSDSPQIDGFGGNPYGCSLYLEAPQHSIFGMTGKSRVICDIGTSVRITTCVQKLEGIWPINWWGSNQACRTVTRYAYPLNYVYEESDQAWCNGGTWRTYASARVIINGQSYTGSGGSSNTTNC